MVYQKKYYSNYEFNEKGIHRNGTMYDDEGYNYEGFDKRRFDRNGIHKNGTLFDKRGFKKSGIHKNGTKYDEQGFDAYGYNASGFNKYGRDKEGYAQDGYNIKGFNRKGFHRNGTLYDDKGFDCNGMNIEGFNRNGFDKDGFDKNGFNKEGYDAAGFDKNGFDKEGYDVTGFDKNGFDKEGFDVTGFDRSGFDKEGFNKTNFNKNGFDKNGFNKEGYDIKGYDKRGFNKEGYNKKGFSKDGYDKEGYNIYGFNRQGIDREGYNIYGYDEEGYDRQGYNRYGFNRNGYNRDGFHRLEKNTEESEKNTACEIIDIVDYLTSLTQGNDVHGVEKEFTDTSFESFSHNKANKTLKKSMKMDYEAVFTDILELSPNLDTFVNNIKQLSIPKNGELKELLSPSSIRDNNAKEKLISRYLRNVLKVALVLSCQYDYDIEDAVSTGTIGLIDAMNNLKSNEPSTLAWYVSSVVQNNIQKECTPVWMYYAFPAKYKTNILRVYYFVSNLIDITDVYAYHSGYDLLEIIANKLGIGIGKAEEYLKMVFYQITRKDIYDLISECENGDNEYPDDYIIDENKMFSSIEEEFLKKEIDSAMKILNKRETQILKMRYGFYREKMTYEQIAYDFNMTKEGVRQTEMRALKKLRRTSEIKKLKGYFE
ncbi:MAG: sigma-70 family RNA polymerase sigma factor [Anaerovoracaceae bacterium]